MPHKRWTWLWVFVPVVLVGLAIAWGMRDRGLSSVRQFTSQWIGGEKAANAPAEHDHDHHAHDHAGHDEANSLHLSEQARKNIGLSADKLQPIQLGSFTRTLDVPARVVERPGRTRVQVGAPMTGVVSAVFALQGEAVQPGTLLFKVRLTHEDLVQAQTVYLQTLGELDVEKTEIARLNKLDERGVIAGKTLLEREYSKQKLEAALNAHREALLLHGLSTAEVDEIAKERRLLRELEVTAPKMLPHGTGTRQSVSIRPVAASETESDEDDAGHPFMVQHVKVQKGTMVQAGDPLCDLADLGELYIEGSAFEQDADEIMNAARMQAAGESGWGVTAIPEDNDKDSNLLTDLTIVYVDNEVEADSRALRFFVQLENHMVHDTTTPNGHRFIAWQFRPGQRMQLRVPIEKWDEQIVVPVEAVAQQGAEKYVFQQNGDHFERVAVHVVYQDQYSAVIANDGTLFPGDVIAMTGAHQMQMALNNKAGGAVDPHAGHSH